MADAWLDASCPATKVFQSPGRRNKSSHDLVACTSTDSFQHMAPGRYGQRMESPGVFSHTSTRWLDRPMSATFQSTGRESKPCHDLIPLTSTQSYRHMAPGRYSSSRPTSAVCPANATMREYATGRFRRPCHEVQSCTVGHGMQHLGPGTYEPLKTSSKAARAAISECPRFGVASHGPLTESAKNERLAPGCYFNGPSSMVNGSAKHEVCKTGTSRGNWRDGPYPHASQSMKGVFDFTMVPSGPNGSAFSLQRMAACSAHRMHSWEAMKAAAGNSAQSNLRADAEWQSKLRRGGGSAFIGV